MKYDNKCKWRKIILYVMYNLEFKVFVFCLNVFFVRNFVFEILFFLIICKVFYEIEMVDCLMVVLVNVFLMML